MNLHVENTLARLLTDIGYRTPPRVISMIERTANYLAAGNWFQRQGFYVTEHLATREILYDRILHDVADKKVLYLEFGVHEGAATRYWAARLRNPQSVLHGFDSFDGLPEEWGDNPKGTFSTAGPPAVIDPRVQFVTGWFRDTLPVYDLPSHDQLVVNIDSDLYSSAKTVLGYLRDAIVPGTYVYFDEFWVRAHEMRAFEEYLAETGQRFALVGVTRALHSAAFQRIG